MHVQPFLSSSDGLLENRMPSSNRSMRPVPHRSSVFRQKEPRPLQLASSSVGGDNRLSPSLPFSGFLNQLHFTPAASSDRLSTTGRNRDTRVPSPIRTPYRDIGLYLEPGSPLLNSFPISPPSSCGDTLNECSSPNTDVDEHCETMSLLKEYDDLEHGASRDSELSFQCMGESNTPSEASWLSPSANFDRNFSRPRPPPLRLSKSLPEKRKVDSWLSDASISDDDENVPAQEAISTSIASSKAIIIDVNCKSPSSLSIKIPPRSSSLTAAHAMPISPDYNNQSWIHDDSPTASELWETHHVPPLPTTRFDIESPPLSPSLYSDSRSSHNESSPGLFPFSPVPKDFDRVANVPIWKQNSSLNVATSLEDSIHYFLDPANKKLDTLMHNSPTISRIRAILSRSAGQLSANTSLPPFSPDPQSNCRGDKRRRRITFSSTSSHGPNPTKPPLNDAQKLPFPNEPVALRALRRIFPRSKDTISALYAYIISYIYVSSLQPCPDTKAFTELQNRSFPHRSSSISTKAANILGISGVEHMSCNTFGKVYDDETRVRRLLERLEICICRLVQVMRDAPDEAEYLDAEFLRSLVEVVRGCEGV